jgi:1-aminocyclopropane-1-carboxylate deaminase/D-cysteine desulfhydrase-like pyridoxal-dependent ACC family enzyme
VECALELTEQCEEMGIQPDWIFLTSTGGGQAGLMLGAKCLRQGHRVVGCAPAPYATDQVRAEGVADLANRTAELLGTDVRIAPEEVVNLNYGGEAYGVITPEGMEAFRLMMHTEGIFLDPVYTSKGVSGLIDQIRKGMVGAEDTVIYVHTGGTPLNFAYSPELVQEFNLTQETDQFMTVS